MIPNFHYITQYPLSLLYTKYTKHRRLRVFATKGCTCVECGVVGTQLILHMDRGKRKHIDVFTEDMVLMTIDHINPKANGGSEHIDNLQPMCTNCNRKKSDKVPADTIFFPSQILGNPEADTESFMELDGHMYETSFQRPREFFRLNTGEQWDIDKWLGILDWEGGCHHRLHRMCDACYSRYQEYYD